MTTQYYLPENKSDAGPGNMLFFDTETTHDPAIAYECGEYQRLKMGCAIAGRLEKNVWTREKRLNFTKAESFWEFVAKCSHPRVPLWLFGHNIGFDLAVCKFPELLKNGTFKLFEPGIQKKKTDILGQQFRKTTGFICVDNPPVIISCTHKEGWKLICVDTFNYWTTSLSKIGEMIGHPKGIMPGLFATQADWYAYCMNDVEVVKKAVLKLVEWIGDNNLGKFRFTAPGQAMAAFRHRFMKHKILCHNNVTIRRFERQAYYGGRLELFHKGQVNERVYELDVTSLYPSVMFENLYPVKLCDFCLPTTHLKFKQIDLGLDCIAEVLLRTKEGYPKRDARIGTIYPTGEYWTTLAGPELMRAKESGDIQEVRGWARYELQELFNDFVEFFWQYRHREQEQGHTLNANLAKLLMNGLYGKFGQMTNGWEDRADMIATPDLDMWTETIDATGAIHLFRSVGVCVQEWVGKQEHPYAFPAIAAYVTAYGRERMYGLRKIAGSENVYYLVTDGLFVNQAGYDRLVDAMQLAEGELGMLRIKSQAPTASFEALHYYTVGEHIVEGSKKKNARKQPDGSFVEIHFEGIDAILKRKPDSSVHVKPVTKRYKREYTRGKALENGTIVPLELCER